MISIVYKGAEVKLDINVRTQILYVKDVFNVNGNLIDANEIPIILLIRLNEYQSHTN